MILCSMSATPLPARAHGRIRTWASFVRFEHTLFSLPLLLAGMFAVPGPAMAAGRWALIALAAVGARSSALALNRIIDRRLDAMNPRTRTRELPRGAMSMPEAWALLGASTIAYLVACAALGRWYLAMSAVPLVVFVVYPYLKRVTPLCHFGVGLALALAPLAGYAAAHPDLARPAPALWLGAFALLWVSGFDVIYATLDEAFDRAHGVHSMVAWLGRVRALRVSAALHAGAAACLLLALAAMRRAAAWSGPHSVLVFVASAMPMALLALEQRRAEDVDLAFFKVNVWVGFAVLAVVLVARAGWGG
jgi:4-hydroxybenzoate polyprenyltransferase